MKTLSRLALFVSFFLINTNGLISQVKLPEDFKRKMKKYDVVLVDSLLDEFTQFKSKATKFTSNFLMFKNPKEKFNAAFYLDSCRNHYNIISELKKDAIDVFGFPEKSVPKIIRDGEFYVIVNSDDYAMVADDSSAKHLSPFGDYNFLVVLAYYNHATKGKIYLVLNFEGDISKKSEDCQNLFYCVKFLPHLPNPGAEPELVIQSGSNNDIYSVACSQSGKLMAYAGAEGVIKILKGDGSKELRSITAHNKSIRKVCFSSNEKLIVSCSLDSTVKLWEVETGKLVATLYGHKSRVNSVAFFDDDRKLISASSDSTIKIWDVETKKTEKTISGFNTKLGVMELNIKTKRAVVGSVKGRLFVIDLKTSDWKEFSTGADEITDVSIPYSNLILYSNGSAIKTLSTETGEIKKLKVNNDSAFSMFTTRALNDAENNMHVLRMTRYGYGEIYDYVNSKTIKSFRHNVTWNAGRKYFDVIYNYAYKLAVYSSNSYCLAYFINTDYHFIIYGAGSIPQDFYPDKKNEIVAVDMDNAFNIFSLKNGRIICSSENKGVNVKNQSKLNPCSGNVSFLSGENEICSYDLALNKIIYSFKPVKIPQSFLSLENDSCFLYKTEGQEIFIHRPGSGSDKKVCDLKTYYDLRLVRDSFLVFQEKETIFLLNIYTEKKVPLNKQSSYEIRVAGIGDERLALYEGETEIGIYDIRSFKKIKNITVEKSAGEIQYISFNPAKKEMAVSTFENYVTIIDYEKNVVVKKMKPHLEYLREPKYTADGKFLLTCGSDGFIKFFETTNYSQVLTNYSASSGSYISFTPEKYYVSSVNNNKLKVQDLAYFSFGNSPMELADLDLEYNRPDIIAKKLGYEAKDIVDAYEKLYEKRMKRLGMDKNIVFKSEGRPLIFSGYSYPPVVYASEQKMFFRLFDRDTGLKSINIIINDVPFAGNDGFMFAKHHQHSKDMEFNLHLQKGYNRISVRVRDENNLESYPLTINTFYGGGSNLKKPKLHIIGIGISEFDSSKYNLKYPVKDVRDFVKLFQNEKNMYSKIIVDTLLNENATLKNILALRDKIEKDHILDSVDVNDKIILFIASHGILDKNLDYYLATRDINFNNPSENGLLYSQIELILEGIVPQNKVVLIDACHSGEIDKEEILVSKKETLNENKDITFREVSSSKITTKEGALKNSLLLMKEMFTDLSKTSGATVISSAGGTEYAIEGEEWNNGVFTYSLINALRFHKADLNKDGLVYLSELKKYIGEDVPRITHGKQQPTSRNENVSNDILIWKNDYNQELTSAIQLNDKLLVDKLISEGADASLKDSNGASVVMWAILYSDLEMVKKLIDKKADFLSKGTIFTNPEKTSFYGSVLGVAAGTNKLDILKFLIEEKKINVNDLEYHHIEKKEVGWPALFWALRYDYPEMVNYLLDKKANVNLAPAADQTSAVLLAFGNCDEKICKRIISLGADYMHCDTMGNNIVFRAAASKFPESLKLAIQKNKNAVNKATKDGYYPVACAAWSARTENFKILVKSGAKTDVVSGNAETILHMAVYSKNLDMLKEAFSACPSAINKQNKWGSTAVTAASLNRDVTLVQFLCEKGADISIKNEAGYNLEETAKYYKDEKMLELVKKYKK